MEQRITFCVRKLLRDGCGIIAIIGDTYTGKTYTLRKILQKLNIRPIPFNFDTVSKTTSVHELQKGDRIQDFYTTSPKPKGDILVCDGLETYSSNVLGFLKKAGNKYPVIIVCDRSISIPSTGIERIWWNAPKRTPRNWKGDTLLQTPRDLFTSLTQSPTQNAIQNFGTDSFILTQYYHDEFPVYKKATLDTIVRNTNALSILDTFRCKDWSSNGLLSTSRASEEIFVRDIRICHKTPPLIPTGWFPKTLSKQTQIGRRTLEISSIETKIPHIRDVISLFNFKIGRSFAYKKEALNITNNPELYSRALEITGNTPLTATEIQKIHKKSDNRKTTKKVTAIKKTAVKKTAVKKTAVKK